jgi:hypothetical protein
MIGNSIKKADPKKPPKGLTRVAIFMYEGYNSIINLVGDEKYISKQDRAFLAGVSLYVFAAATMGMVGLTPTMSDFNVALSVTLVAMLYIYFQGFKMYNYNIFKYI